MSLAIQLLQCKPENFVSQKVTSVSIRFPIVKPNVQFIANLKEKQQHSINVISCHMKCRRSSHSIFVSIRIHIRIQKVAPVALARPPIMHITFYQLRIVQFHLVHSPHPRQRLWYMAMVSLRTLGVVLVLFRIFIFCFHDNCRNTIGKKFKCNQ